MPCSTSSGLPLFGCCNVTPARRKAVRITLNYFYSYPGGPFNRWTAWAEELRQRVIAIPFPAAGLLKDYYMDLSRTIAPSPANVVLSEPTENQIPSDPHTLHFGEPNGFGYRANNIVSWGGTTTLFSVTKFADTYGSMQIVCRVLDDYYNDVSNSRLVVSEQEVIPEVLTIQNYEGAPHAPYISTDLFLAGEGGPDSCNFAP